MRAFPPPSGYVQRCRHEGERLGPSAASFEPQLAAQLRVPSNTVAMASPSLQLKRSCRVPFLVLSVAYEMLPVILSFRYGQHCSFFAPSLKRFVPEGAYRSKTDRVNHAPCIAQRSSFRGSKYVHVFIHLQALDLKSEKEAGTLRGNSTAHLTLCRY